MDLYKRHGVNPVGGCFPMLLQIPFLYAFYKVLAISIEMRHAPWFGWIRDLSAKDPYYILPIVMTLTMFLLQKMTPQTATDPAQQKMFMFMPLIFGFMFMNVSSGLVLYWLVGNLVGIAQQWYINKAGLGAAPPRKPALAAK
jgi:YidC/Oxa1 family membrane protein insertase